MKSKETEEKGPKISEQNNVTNEKSVYYDDYPSRIQKTLDNNVKYTNIIIALSVAIFALGFFGIIYGIILKKGWT